MTPVSSTKTHVQIHERDSLSNVVFVVHVCERRVIINGAIVIEGTSPRAKPSGLEFGLEPWLCKGVIRKPLVIISHELEALADICADLSAGIAIKTVEVDWKIRALVFRDRDAARVG